MRKKNLRLVLLGMLLGILTLPSQLPPALASDHTDTPILIEAGRSDARITDFWSFVQDGRLVMIMGINPFLPSDVREYVFPTDVTYSFFIDRDSSVNFNNPANNAAFGGTIDRPARIREDVRFDVTFDKSNKPHVDMGGWTLAESDAIRPHIRLFTGLRSEAFIFAPFVNNNIAAIVIDVPLSLVRRTTNPLILWCSTKVDEFGGPSQELAGRTLYSQFDEKLGLNFLHPSQHQAVLGLNPDVIILNTAKASKFPNGRRLQDDIVDLVAKLPVPFNDARAFNLEFDLAGFHATVNDVAPFPGVFPHLANPH